MPTMKTRKSLTPEQIKTMKVLVVGLARSGIAACNVLRDMGVHVKATDALEAPRLGPEVAKLKQRNIEMELGRNSTEFAGDCDLLVLSPGVALNSPLVVWARGQGKTVIGEVELAFCLSDARFIAVTGTNGKSTTVSLLGDIVSRATDKVRVGGNIGYPISEIARGLGDDWTLVIEVSSFQLDTCISFRPSVSVLLNITPDHLDRYTSYDEYVKSKARIFANQTEEDVAVINRDDPDSLRAAGGFRGRKLFYSLVDEVEEGAFIRGDDVVVRVGGTETGIFVIGDMRIRGPHNLANGLAATLAATAIDIEPEVIKQAISSFDGLEHRLERVDSVAGVEFINDSKSTNLDSLRCALEAMPGPLILIAGGKDKGADFAGVADLIQQKVKGIQAIGDARDKIVKAFSGFVSVVRADTLDEAVRKGFELSQPGEAVLLSPGCASYDMFTDFEHRGREFKRAVADLKREREGLQDA
jgi:UDP-N-acetylmuramoylalanine--D-glutamate ligase